MQAGALFEATCAKRRVSSGFHCLRQMLLWAQAVLTQEGTPWSHCCTANRSRLKITQGFSPGCSNGTGPPHPTQSQELPIPLAVRSPVPKGRARPISCWQSLDGTLTRAGPGPQCSPAAGPLLLDQSLPFLGTERHGTAVTRTGSAWHGHISRGCVRGARGSSAVGLPLQTCQQNHFSHLCKTSKRWGGKDW